MPTMLAFREAAAPMPMTFPEHVVKYVKESPDIMDGIRRGVADLNEGKVTPWEDVKRELGLG